jgi:hypothetical protein
MFGTKRLSMLRGNGVSVDCQAGQMTIVIYRKLVAPQIRGQELFFQQPSNDCHPEPSDRNFFSTRRFCVSAVAESKDRYARRTFLANEGFFPGPE